MELLSSTGKANGASDTDRYAGVVLVEFPRPGIRSIGLITSQMYDSEGQEVLAIYVPTTPIPSSGFLVIVPTSQVTRLEMSVEEANERSGCPGGFSPTGCFSVRDSRRAPGKTQADDGSHQGQPSYVLASGPRAGLVVSLPRSFRPKQPLTRLRTYRKVA